MVTVIDDAASDEPEEGDLYTHDHRTVYVWGGRRKPALIVDDVARFNATVRAFMKRDNFFPNVWFISDHGNAHLIDINAPD